MATATAIRFETTAELGDVIRRGIKRTLPCDLTDAEFMQIAKQRVDKEALLDQLEADFDKIKTKHKVQVEELDGEIGKARQELHTGQQDRTVLCVEVFRRAEDGTGWVHTLRMDTIPPSEVERRPASPSEAQRYLPGVEGMPVDEGAPLEQAAAAQAGESVRRFDDGGVASELDDDNDEGAQQSIAGRDAGAAIGTRDCRST